MNKLYPIILLSIICHLSHAATIDLGTVCTDVVLNFLSTNDLQIGDELVWVSADSDLYSGLDNGDGVYNFSFFQNGNDVTGFAAIAQGDAMRIVGNQIGSDTAGAIGGNCPAFSESIISVVPATTPSLCTKQTIQDSNNNGGIPIGGTLEYITPSHTDPNNTDWVDAFEYNQNTDGIFNSALYINNVQQSFGTKLLYGGDMVRWEGIAVGSDYVSVLGGTFNSPTCSEDWTGTVIVSQTSPPTLCTEQVIDSLEAGSPFSVGESLEWIGLGDDNILFEGLDGVSDITLLRNGMNIGSGATYQSGDNMRINFISTGFEGAESTSTATCAASALTIFQITAALPVTWLKPTQAILQNEKVSISFATAQELNNDRFEIEHSADGYTFEHIAELKGQGTTARETYYEYMHDTPVSGTNYYRIKQIDYDGSYDYSNIASVIYHSALTQIYPNPVSDILHISSVQKLDYTLLDRDGRIVLSGSTLDQSSIDMSVISAGVYFLRLGDDVKRVVKIL